MNKILVIFGTRPEFIKLMPVIDEFDRRGLRGNLIIVNTNQHNSLLKQFIGESKILIDYTLDIDNQSNSLPILSSEIIKKLEIVINEIQLKEKIDLVIVQGDTSSTYCASLVAFYNKISIHYIEAGLRTYDEKNPFPEEFHRRAISLMSDYLYAPTESARVNLENEGISPQKILVVGNTIIDGLLKMEKLNFVNNADSVRNTILCTIHRRENHGKNLVYFIESIIKLAEHYSQYNFVLISHPNPSVKKVLDDYSSQKLENLIISDPLPYLEMLNKINTSCLIITDSGGLLEEASFFLVPVIVLRNKTERVDSVNNNIAVCLNCNDHSFNSLFHKMIHLKIDESKKYLYGNGNAAIRIVDSVLGSAK